VTASLPRDERGWRIPREGTKSHHLYQLLILGYSAAEICNLYHEDYNTSSIKVLIHNIRRPNSHNFAANQWYQNNNKRAREILKKSRSSPDRKGYSNYVKKLVKALGISFTEAVALEKKYDGSSSK